MNRRCMLAAVAVIGAAVLGGVDARAAGPVACEGTVQLTGMSNVQVAAAGANTLVEFDFTGLHELCLRDGSRATGAIAGHLVQRASADGDLGIRFDETLSYAGGTLAYRGEASLADGAWQSHVQTVGAGTGPLAGIQGQGAFWFTGPTSLADVISYVYVP